MSKKRKLTWGGGYHDKIIIGNYGNFFLMFKKKEKNGIMVT